MGLVSLDIKPKPKRLCDSIEQPQEVQPPILRISLPNTAYVNAPATTGNDLHDRLRAMEIYHQVSYNYNII